MSLASNHEEKPNVSMAPLTAPEPVINPGTYSIGYLHPDVPWVVPGIYQIKLTSGRMAFLYLHDAINTSEGKYRCVNGHTPLYATVVGARFVTVDKGPWVLMEKIEDLSLIHI